MSSPPPNELQRYQKLLGPPARQDTASSSACEELELAPLIWWDVKEELDKDSGSNSRRQQYAILGHETDENKSSEDAQTETKGPKPVLLNTNSPWSAFLCGSQGSGKSHALSCMLENCLLVNEDIGKNPHPLAGLVFHYDSSQSSGVCEAAYLCSSVKTKVLVSESNEGQRREQYEKMARDTGGNVTVESLKLSPSHLTAERLKTLMAVGKEDNMPLYMHVVMKILRQLSTANGGRGTIDYDQFKLDLATEGFDQRQNQPFKMRIELMESFMKLNGVNPDPLIGQPGELLIVDLTDPIIDPDDACVLFHICLSIFISQTQCGKIIALDEAHNFMEDKSAAAQQFTDKLLKTIREQRHQGARIVIATQEPNLNTSFLDLCSITMIHRCTSPSWYSVLKNHIASLFLHGKRKQDNENGQEIDSAKLFQMIVELKLGESLLFCPTAAVGVGETGIERMIDKFVKFRTRQRITADGGRTRLADG